jgi:sterol desaturase/sphingolipid hydroxylase (fatty acid hydroxylase superfamily)
MLVNRLTLKLKAMEEIMKVTNEVRFFAFLEFARYFAIAGGAYFLFYSLKKDKWLHKKIQQRFPKNKNIWYEIKYSIINLLMFAALALGNYWLKENGYTKMYERISDYGVPYFIFSIVAMILLHDTYFYWTHRFMHLKKVYPYVHQVHHHSTNPTPWAAYAFHPIEGLINYAILTIIIVIIPTHIIAVSIWLLYSIILNVGGHLGYELFPKGFTKHKLLGLSNTSTHHNMHHSYFDCNYGIYFNFWDKLMNTNHENYHETFDKVARAEPETLWI